MVDSLDVFKVKWNAFLEGMPLYKHGVSFNPRLTVGNYMTFVINSERLGGKMGPSGVKIYEYMNS